MITIQELRQEAIRARDEHGNTDFYTLLNEAADTIEDLCKQIDGCVRVAADALKTLQKERKKWQEIQADFQSHQTPLQGN